MANPTRPRPRWQFPALVLTYFTAVGLLHFGYLYLDDLTRGHSGTAVPRLIEELTGAYGAALLFPVILWLARRFRLTRESVARRIPVHLGAIVVVSAVHTSLNAISRALIFPLAGLGHYDYGIMRIRYFMELPNDVVGYCILVGFIHLFDHYTAARDRELRTAQLESQLTRSQLQSLRVQLQPHFLFNALNTISSVMYDSPGAADRMIAQLAELLRVTLRHSEAQEITLEEELRVLVLYVDLLRARFEERLQLEISAAPDTRAALVPQLLLQPLVENAVRHGFERSGDGRIGIHVQRRDGVLELEVRDHGPGLSASPAEALKSGIGLSNTAARLQQLYGGRQRLQLVNAVGGGLRVTIELPFREAT